MTEPSPPPSWKAHLVAVFVTVHIVCVLVCALPRPPVLHDEALEHPEVKAEMAQGFRALHNLVPWRDTPEEQMGDVLRWVRGYTAGVNRLCRLVEPYLEAVGTTQSWHMFGGTPPRFPLVLVVEVRPEGENEYVLFQDLRWGTADSAALNFRHRKVHEALGARVSQREWDAYAAYWARRWDESHPDRPAEKVRLSFTRLTTPSPEQVRTGNADRRPETGLQESEWERP